MHVDILHRKLHLVMLKAVLFSKRSTDFEPDYVSRIANKMYKILQIT